MTWRAVGDKLASTGAHVIAIDQRSHGRSDITEDGYDFATWAADLAAVVDQAGARRPVAAGQSWGGNVVVETAFRHPGVMSAVVGIDGGHIQLAGYFDTWEACAAALAPPRFDGITRADLVERIRLMHPDWSETGIQGTLANFTTDHDDQVRPNLPFDHHMTILRALYEQRPFEMTAALEVPTLLLAARSDARPVDPDAGFDEIVLVAGDHDLHVQQPELVADHLERVAPWA